MRQWRVGTFSMGASLLLLGIGLLFTQILKLDIGTVMISWWPVLFIVLGIEILLYLFIGKNEQSYVKFDLLSIFFIGVIGTVGIGLTTIQSMGLNDVMNQYIYSQYRTLDLPEYAQKMPKQIKRIYIDANDENVHIEAMEGEEVALFGTFGGEMLPSNTLKEVEEYAQIVQQGDTLFITLKKPQFPANIHNWYELNTKIILPQHIDVELKNSNQLEFDSRKVQANWSISNISDLRLTGNKIAEKQLNEDGAIDSTQIKLADKHVINMKKITNYEPY